MNTEYHIILLRRAKKKWLRELNRKRKSRIMRKMGIAKDFYIRSSKVRPNKFNLKFTTKYPEKLCLRTNLDEINTLFKEARRQIFELRIKTWTLDHSMIKHATPECILYLIAELYNIVSQTDGLRVVPRGKSMDPITEDLLNGSGYNDYFNRALGTMDNKLRKSLLYKDRIYIKHEKGATVDTEVAAKFVKEFSQALNYSETRREKLTTALGECIMNAVGHAYIKDGVDLLPGVPKMWWVMGYTEKESRKAYFVILDRGVGMAQTINENKLREWFGDQMHFIPFLSKSQLIKKAFERPSSSTKQDGRGFGLPTLKRYAELSTSGELYVRSHKSMLRFGKSQQCEDLDQELDGTMLVWEVDSFAA